MTAARLRSTNTRYRKQGDGMKRTFAAAIFALVAITAPAHAATIQWDFSGAEANNGKAAGSGTGEATILSASGFDRGEFYENAFSKLGQLHVFRHSPLDRVTTIDCHEAICSHLDFYGINVAIKNT
jgi:hypothetical protein